MAWLLAIRRKINVMANFNYFRIFLLISIIGLHSCIVVDNSDMVYGPDGRDGKAFFGIDYDQYEPYSYWDNNPSMPTNPFYGEFYRSYPGIYQFEYFINSQEYWYGTYELNIDRGEPGRPHGVAGRDGDDSYLRLICNDDGFYFERSMMAVQQFNAPDGTVTVEAQDEIGSFRVVMQKTTILERPTTRTPKK